MTTKEKQDCKDVKTIFIGRRTLLKALSAAGLSAISSYLIPEAWAAPTRKKNVAPLMELLLDNQEEDLNTLEVSLELDEPVALLGQNDSGTLLGIDEITGILNRDSHDPLSINDGITSYNTTHRVNMKVNFRSPVKLNNLTTSMEHHMSDYPPDWRSYSPLRNYSYYDPKNGTYSQVCITNMTSSAPYYGSFNCTGWCQNTTSRAFVTLRANTSNMVSPYLFSNNASCRLPWPAG